MLIGIYIRVSTDEQAAEGYSLAEQEQVIDALEDMCVRLTQRRRKRWLRHWRRLRGLPTTRR